MRGNQPGAGVGRQILEAQSGGDGLRGIVAVAEMQRRIDQLDRVMKAIAAEDRAGAR